MDGDSSTGGGQPNADPTPQGEGGRRRVPVDGEAAGDTADPVTAEPQVDEKPTNRVRVPVDSPTSPQPGGANSDDAAETQRLLDNPPPTETASDPQTGTLEERADSYIIAVGAPPTLTNSTSTGNGTDSKPTTTTPATNGGPEKDHVGNGSVAKGAVAGGAVAAAGGDDEKKAPVYTEPPEDALIRGWGGSDFAGFLNVTRWSAARWGVTLRYWKTWGWEHRGELYQDCLIGFAVALAQVPEAIAFAFVAGMPPIIGLYGTIVLGFFTSLLGGRPGMISGTSGAVGVVQAKLVNDFNDMSPQEQQDLYGTNNPAEVVLATLLLMGGVEILLGVLQIGRVIDLMGTPVMIGFVNGLAMLIGRSQMSNFRRFNNETLTSDDPFLYEDRDDSFVEGQELGYTLLLTFAGMATMLGVPVIFDYFTNLNSTSGAVAGVKRLFSVLSTVPPTLYAILVTLAINQAGDLGTLTVENKAVVKGEFIAWHVPDVTWSTKMFGELIGHACIWAVVSMVEGVMTLTLLSEMIGDEGNPHQDMIAQGLGNLACGLLRGQGGDAMIGQSLINVKSGGIRRRSGVLASVFIMIFVVVASDFINIIPLGGLAGVMFVVVIFTFEWNTFRLFFQIPIVDSIVIIVVTLVTYFLSDLSIGVACGIGISALYYAYTSGHRLSARTEYLEDQDADGTKYRVKIYHLDGNLFFGSLRSLQKLMTPEKDPEVVIVHLGGAKTFDMSAAQGLADMTERYANLGKEFRVAGLSPTDAEQLSKIHHITKVLTVDDFDRSDGDHHFERRREVRRGRRRFRDRFLGRRASVLNPEAAAVGQASNMPESWNAPHHLKDE